MTQQSGLTPLETAATAAHETYLAFVNAGFTEEQALDIIVGMFTQKN